MRIKWVSVCKALGIVPGTLKTCHHIVFATVILCMGNLDLCFSGFRSDSQYGFIHSRSSVYLTWYCEYGAKWREKGVHIAPVRPVLLLVMRVCVGGGQSSKGEREGVQRLYIGTGSSYPSTLMIPEWDFALVVSQSLVQSTEMFLFFKMKIDMFVQQNPIL